MNMDDTDRLVDYESYLSINNPIRAFLSGAWIYVRTCTCIIELSLFSAVADLKRIVSTDDRSKRTAKDNELLLELKCFAIAPRGRSRSMKKLEQLIKEGANVNCIEDCGGTSLHYSLYSAELTAFLIEHGADLSAVLSTGATPLHIAAHHHSWRGGVLPVLLYYNADTSVPDQRGNTPIMYLMKETTFIDERNTALLLEYEYNSNCVNEAGSSLLTLAMITQRQHIIDDIIERGGNFSNLPGDLEIFMWCIDQPEREEFKWFWNVFSYKEAWFFKQPILYHLLKKDNYESFDFVIESPKLQEVLDVWFDDHEYKKGTVLGNLEEQEEKFTLVHILNATATRNYNPERAKTAIYRLLSYGYVPSEQEVLQIYEVFGDGELFNLCLNLDISEPSDSYSFSSLVPKILLNPDISGQDIINRCVINASDFRRESLIATMPHIYDHWTNKDMTKIYNNDQETLDQQSPRRVPRLLELSRNQSLLGIWKKYKIRRRSHFGTVLKQIVPTLIRDLILFKTPIYSQQ